MLELGMPKLTAPQLNAIKTHCKHGHEFTPENTIWKINTYHGGKQRKCRACTNAQRSAKRRAEGKPERKAGALRLLERRFISLSLNDLRRLIAAIWDEATEGTETPSKSTADRLIEKILSVSNGE